MADLNVERRGPNIWPFVIGAIVVALLAWGLISLFDRDEEWRIEAPADVTETPPATQPPAGPAEPAAP